MRSSHASNGNKGSTNNETNNGTPTTRPHDGRCFLDFRLLGNDGFRTGLFHPFVGLFLQKLCAMDGSELCPTLDFARLFKMFPPTHFLFKTAAFDQFAKPTNRFLDGLFIPND